MSGPHRLGLKIDIVLGGLVGGGRGLVLGTSPVSGPACLDALPTALHYEHHRVAGQAVL